MYSFVRQYRSAFIYTCVFVVGIFYCFSQIQSPSAVKTEPMKVVTFGSSLNVDKYRVQRGGEFLKYREVMTLLSEEDSDLIHDLTGVIKRKHDAVFWECTPVDRMSFSSKDFEFVVIPAPSLAERRVDSSSFQDKFDSASSQPVDIITFQNLGKDSTLVVPMPPRDSAAHMTHLTSFLRNGDARQVSHLWKKVGATFLATINEERDQNRKFWLSTSGLGVSWLHVRIDTVPKYYNWQEYKGGR